MLVLICWGSCLHDFATPCALPIVAGVCELYLDSTPHSRILLGTQELYCTTSHKAQESICE